MVNALQSCANAIRRALTTADNATPDIIRIGTVMTGAAMLFNSVWSVIVNKAVPTCLDLGGGIGALFAGAGIALGAKRKEEAQ